MPCHDPRPAECFADAIKKCHTLTRLLCEACSSLKNAGLIHASSEELRQWWTIHQRDDAERSET